MVTGNLLFRLHPRKLSKHFARPIRTLCSQHIYILKPYPGRNTMDIEFPIGYSKTALDVSLIYYDSNDWLSYIFAWISLTPQTILIIYATLILSRREAETVLLLGGQVGCELVNNYLKKIIREERPIGKSVEL